VKKFLFISLFSLVLLFPVMSIAQETVLYRQAVDQLKLGNYGNAIKIFTEDCNNNDVAGCSMIAVAEYGVDHQKSVSIAKLWLNFLSKSKDPHVLEFRKSLINTYIQFYKSQGADVSWLEHLK
jgi:hypothetical protein